MTNLFINKEGMDRIGSWHPRGYHGHSRAKSRIEFSNFYRESAKPLPPEKFRLRQKDDVFKHVFSKHDNKQIFLNDPNLFGSGFGKRKIDNKNKSLWNPEFISWKDESGRDRFRKSIYQNDFCSLPISAKLLSNRKSMEPTSSASVYTCNYTPNTQVMNQELKEIRENTFLRFTNKNRSKSCIGDRSNVASCLVWHDAIKKPSNNNKSIINLNLTSESVPYISTGPLAYKEQPSDNNTNVNTN